MATFGTASPRERSIACVQFDSKHADVSRNVDTVLDLVSKLISTSIDLLVLPELALTGYVFENSEEISSLFEDARSFSSPSSLLASTSPPPSPATFISACRSSCVSSSSPSLTLGSHLAQYLCCHVVIGFPERASHEGYGSHVPFIEAANEDMAPPLDARPKDAQIASNDKSETHCAYNSAALFAPDGSLEHVFRKHFLFETDEKWASEGSGFESLHIPNLGNICVAICMDLNPFQFRTPFESCELASFCVKRDVDLLIMPMAWLLPKDEQQKPTSLSSLSTINYWALRCLPFLDPQNTLKQPSHSAAAPADTAIGYASSPSNKMRYLIATNRVGTEVTSTFAGSSCVLQMKPGQRPLLLASLDTVQEACLVVGLPS